jgi:hypothetical protein
MASQWFRFCFCSQALYVLPRFAIETCNFIYLTYNPLARISLKMNCSATTQNVIFGSCFGNYQNG